RIMCHEIFGTVERINTQEELPYAVGDRAVVFPLISCASCEACSQGDFHVCRSLQIMGLHRDGGFAQYVKASSKSVFKVPDCLSDEEAALTEPMAVGFHANMRAKTAFGDRVLIIGGGPIGLLSAINASMFGASKVIISEVNPERAKFCRKFGFEVFNPLEQDLETLIKSVTDGTGFDRVFEASGSAGGALTMTEACHIRGTIVPLGIPTQTVSYATVQMIFKELSVIGSRVYTREHFRRALEEIARIKKNCVFDLKGIIDRIIGLDELRQGIEIQSEGKNMGKIIVEV
ncbi:MAG: zinc-binding dehydrogenase, partial [Oscillospiraceae bacterium]|nr:zinc-binding dehydrogenase [Oscillospiraceae bacterium]